MCAFFTEIPQFIPPIRINHNDDVCMFMHSSVVIEKHNIAFGFISHFFFSLCLFPFSMRNILLKLNNELCIVRHDLRFNQAIQLLLLFFFSSLHIFLSFICCFSHFRLIFVGGWCWWIANPFLLLSVPCTLIPTTA